MNERLIILSDLHGAQQSQWIELYVLLLNRYSQVSFFDSRILAEIDVSLIDKEEIHQQFIKDGIEKAVRNLIKTVSDPVDILGFSVGGVIAWQAALNGLNVNKFVAVSSTRLRYEKQKPTLNLKLLYGGNDENVPNPSWFKSLDIEPILYKDVGHDFYKDEKCIEFICSKLN